MSREGFLNNSFDIFLKEKIEKRASYKLGQTKTIEDVMVPGILSKFTISPLPQGYGQTIGNSLRRVLLSSISGYSIAVIKAVGVRHEFDTIKGVREDVLDIIMNLKNIAIRNVGLQKDVNSCEFVLPIEKEGDVLGEHIICSEGFEISNPKHFICYSDGTTKTRIHMLVVKGRGSINIEDYKLQQMGEIDSGESYVFVDSRPNPVKRVEMRTHQENVGSKSECERLELFIETSGANSPRAVFEESLSIIVSIFVSCSEQHNLVASINLNDSFSGKELPFDKILYETITKLGLKGRAERGLIANGINLIGDLVTTPKNNILQIPNVGTRSVEEVLEALKPYGLTLGMKIEGWDKQKPLSENKYNVAIEWNN